MERKLYRLMFVSMIFLYQFSQMAAFALPLELHYPLSEELIPRSYEVTITNNIDGPEPNYSGDVRIKVDCATTTSYINFHEGKNLDVKVEAVEVKLLTRKHGDVQFSIIGKNYFSGNQRRVALDKELEKGNEYEIKIKFFSDFSKHSTGYIFKTYKIHGDDDTIEPRGLAFTKLNEFDARKVIPCLDEMHFKAKFKMWLIHPKRLKAFSNAALKSSEDITINGEDWVKDEFHETEDMATFSLAMALAQFETTGFDNSAIVNVRTWADEDVIEKMVQINQFASKSFVFFSQFFKTVHPLGKLDILILPEVDFEVEESFGLIYMSQKYVLDVLEKSSNTKTFAMVSRICHAVSYQWIGSSVTMTKWDDTWLHQGLNHFLREECAKKIFPQYSRQILELNTIKSFTDFMRSEELAEYDDEPISLLKSYPHIKFIKFATFEKVHQLIRMIHFILGPDLFRQSLADYVNEFSCRNSDLDTALGIFTKTANSVEPKILPIFVGIQTIISSWLHQTGIPLIIVQRRVSGNGIIVVQETFDAFELSPDGEHASKKFWQIPLSCTTQVELKFDARPNFWLKNNKHPHHWNPEEDLSEDKWVLCNLEMNVPGRVLYEQENWESIQKFLLDKDKFKQINVLTRARIVSDMFTLAEAGKLRYEIVFSTMEYLHNEEDIAPWHLALKEFDRIRSRLLGSSSGLFKRYQERVRKILEPVIQKRMVKSLQDDQTENDEERHFQIFFIEIACKFRIKTCKDRSSDFIKKWNKPNTKEKPEWLYRINTIKECDDVKNETNGASWKELWNKLPEINYDSPQGVSSLQVLACSEKTDNLRNLLERSINESDISREVNIIIFEALSLHEKGYEIMKTFYKKLYKKTDRFHPPYPRYLRALLDVTNREKHLKEVMKFATSKIIDMTDELTERSKNNAVRNINWVRRNKAELKNILSKHRIRKVLKSLKNFT